MARSNGIRELAAPVLATVLVSLLSVGGWGELEAAEPPVVPIPNARLFDASVLLGGQPTLEQLEQAAAAGYRTVVNLRGPDEHDEWDEAAAVGELGMEYVSIPIAGAGDLDEARAKRLAAQLDDSERRPMIVHCGSGNRVGALLALRAFHVGGASADEAVALGLDNGLTSLEPKVREYLAGRADSGSP